MTPPPWQETPTKVIVEFKKDSGLVHRFVRLTHDRSMLPPQLQQRVPFELWSHLLVEAETLAQQHPFAWQPEKGSVFAWCGGYLCIPCIAIGRALGDDAIALKIWLERAQAMVGQFQPAFAAYGVSIGLSGIHGSQWIQLEVGPVQAPPGPGGYHTGVGMIAMCAPTFAGPVGPVGPF